MWGKNYLLIFIYFLGKPDEILKTYAGFNTKTRLYECTLCQKTSSQKANLMKHIESIHFPNYFIYTCDFCKLTFPSRNTLYKHNASYHKNQKYLKPL